MYGLALCRGSDLYKLSTGVARYEGQGESAYLNDDGKLLNLNAAALADAGSSDGRIPGGILSNVPDWEGSAEDVAAAMLGTQLGIGQLSIALENPALSGDELSMGTGILESLTLTTMSQSMTASRFVVGTSALQETYQTLSDADKAALQQGITVTGIETVLSSMGGGFGSKKPLKDGQDVKLKPSKAAGDSDKTKATETNGGNGDVGGASNSADDFLKSFDRSKYRFFKADGAVEHFDKHGSELMGVFGRSSYNMKNYLDDAHHTIQNGTYVPEMNGFVRLIGGEGSAKYAFVGLDRATGNLTTFHVKTASELSKRAPSLGITK